MASKVGNGRVGREDGFASISMPLYSTLFFDVVGGVVSVVGVILVVLVVGGGGKGIFEGSARGVR